MYICDICGRECKKKIRLGGYTLCSKHMHQLQHYGKFLDNIQRTNNDLNDYIIKDNITEFNVYNQKNVKVGSFIIDTEDIEKVKYHKWRFGTSYGHTHVITGLPARGTCRDLSHVILDIPKEKSSTVVDHINGNPMDNRKCNLRICTQGQNCLNKQDSGRNTSGFIGVSYDKSKHRYDPAIRGYYKRCHLGYTKTLKEAVYKRYIAEEKYFSEFCNKEEHQKKYDFTKDLLEDKKNELYNIVKNKMKEKGLWQ